MTIKTDSSYQDLGQTQLIGYILICLGIFTTLVFSIGLDGEAVFRLSRPRDPFFLPNLVVPAGPYNFLISFILVFLGVRLLVKKMSNYSSFYLAFGFFLLITCFLVWATAGKSFSLTGMLQATVVRAVPIALAGLAGVLSERVAVINIGIEGMLLVGAFAGAVFGSLFGGIVGLLLAILVGAIFGLLLAILVITYRVDQIIAGG